MAEPPPIPIRPLTSRDMSDLARARQLLESPGLAVRLSNTIGAPLERGFKLLPANWADTVHHATQKALFKALDVAIISLGNGPRPRRRAGERAHRWAAGAVGGFGGAFGLAALTVELPLSTTLMLRSIAAIAQSEGQELTRNSTRLACLEVFAIGGRSHADDAAESGYWAVRLALAKAVSEALKHLGERGIVEKAAPAMVRFVATIASRFGVVVSEQIAAKAVPIVGAAGGAVVNVLFMDHFQAMARGHFIIKRLEAQHGFDQVRLAYESLG